MRNNDQQKWLYIFSSILSGIMVILIISFFAQSYFEMREMKPIKTAIDRIQQESE